MSDGNILPLKFNSDRAKKEFYEAIRGLPKDVKLYLVGGSVRNALIREFHRQDLIQRDYDQVITEGTVIYEGYLKALGFKQQPYPSRQDIQTVFNKPLKQGELNWDYTDYIVFDMHTVDGTTIEDNIINNVCFTINGCAINASDILTKPWEEALIQVLPTALQDIQDKKLKVNRKGYKFMPSNFYAMLRFMSVGFTPPSKDEVNLLLQELSNIEHARFQRNVNKIFEYVGGEEKARDLVKSLGIEFDVFNEEVVKSKLRSSALAA